MPILGCVAAPSARLDLEVSRLVETPYPGDRGMWDFINGQEGSSGLSKDARGMILPHHFSDQFQIMKFWRDVGTLRSPQTIVLLSPDHFMPFPGDLHSTNDAVFKTVYGQVPLAVNFIDRLKGAGVDLNAQLFRTEHGIYVHTAFIARYMPKAKLIPIVIKQHTERAKLDSLVAELQELCKREDTFVAASVDFSHYNPVQVSRFHDMAAQSAIENFDLERLDKLEIDSPDSLYVLMKLMKSVGAQRAECLGRTDLQEHFDYPISDNTSHLYFQFRPGFPTIRPSVNMMIFPISERKVFSTEIPSSWIWDWRNPEKTSRMAPWLTELAGEEDRFLMGADLYLFGRPPRTTQTLVSAGVDISVTQWESSIPTTFQRHVREGGIEVAVWDKPNLDQTENYSFLDKSGIDLAVIRRQESGKLSWFFRGRCLVLLVPGIFDQQPGEADVKASVVGLNWSNGKWTVIDFPIEHKQGIPILTDKPLRASTDPLGTKEEIE